MKKSLRVYILIFISLDIIVGINLFKRNKSLPKEKESIENCLNNVFGWSKSKDIDVFINSISADILFISITPYNKVVNFPKGIKKNKKIWLDPRFIAIDHKIEDLKVNVSKSGNNAWFYCKLHDYNKWDGKDISWENIRWTGILEKRNNEWKLVQQHFSFADE